MSLTNQVAVNDFHFIATHPLKILGIRTSTWTTVVSYFHSPLPQTLHTATVGRAGTLHLTMHSKHACRVVILSQ